MAFGDVRKCPACPEYWIEDDQMYEDPNVCPHCGVDAGDIMKDRFGGLPKWVPSPAELIPNGTFDTDTTGWSTINNATLASVAGGKSGKCLQITENGLAPPGASKTIVVIPKLSHRFQIYVKAGTEATYRVILYDVMNGGDLWDSGDLEETAGDWSTEVLHDFVAPVGCTSVKIQLFQMCLVASGTTMLYDSASLKKH